jgi:hypothetical protein
MREVILILGILSFIASPSFAADQKLDRKQIYELRKDCGKTCAQRFKEEFGKEGLYSSGKEEHGARSYASHYNAKLNKCFILITDRHFGGTTPGLIMMLWDINENMQYGEMVVLDGETPNPSDRKGFFCNVLKKRCYSEQEWDALVKPYMEE